MPLIEPINTEKMKAKRDVRGLITALEHNKDMTIRQQAALALGQIGDAQAIPALILALENNNSSLRQAAIQAIVQIGAPAAESLITVLQSGGKVRPIDLHIQAALALGQIGDTRAIPALIMALGTYNDELSKAAIKALVQIGPPAVEPLIAALQRESMGISLNAIEALVMIRDKRATEPIIAFIMRNLDRHHLGDRFDSLAAKALGWTGSPGAVEPLITILERDPKSQPAKKALVKIGSSAINSLVTALQAGDRDMRLAAGEILGKLGWSPEDNRAVTTLIDMLNYRDKKDRLAAAKILTNLGWEPEGDDMKAHFYVAKQQWDQCVRLGLSAVAPLIKVLEDTSLRQPAIEALIKIGKPAVEPLIAVFQEEHSPGIEVYQTVAEALGKIGDEHAVELLITILINESKIKKPQANKSVLVVRQAAARALIAIYRTGDISDVLKNKILTQRDTILKKHDDFVHDESCHHPGGLHHDTGIGIRFSL